MAFEMKHTEGEDVAHSHPGGNDRAHEDDAGSRTGGDAGPALDPVAIVGMACRLPGDVSSLDEFWDMICRGRNGWSGIPKDRFSKGAYWHPNPAKKGAFNLRGGYFLKPQQEAFFDAPFFNITRAEAEAMGMLQTVRTHSHDFPASDSE